MVESIKIRFMLI